MRETTPGRRGAARARRPAGRPGTTARTAARTAARTERHTAQSRRRPAAAGAAQGRSLTVTHRAAVLGAALCAVVLMLAYPTRGYLQERSQIAAAQAEQRSLAAQIQQLTAQHAADLTPAQIEAQARSRLHFTSPGTRNFIQLTPPPAPAKATRAGNATVPAGAAGSWFATLWGSAQSAGS